MRNLQAPASVDRHSIDSRRRDSDASICSSLVSSIGASASLLTQYKERAVQVTALKTINAYLQRRSMQILRLPLPSSKQITDTLKFLLRQLDLGDTKKLEEELPRILREFGCPVPLKPTIIRTPSTPHAWPLVLAAIHWVVQFVRYIDEVTSEACLWQALVDYHLNSYSHHLHGDEEAEKALDSVYLEQIEQEGIKVEETLSDLKNEVAELENKIQARRSTPTQREMLEKERADLIEDDKKFRAVVEGFSAKMAAHEKEVAEKKKELAAKMKDASRICEEGELLKQAVEEQKVSVRDAERMKRELAAVERDIAEAEIGRSAWEDKGLELSSKLGQCKKEVEELISDCNQAIKRLKLGIDFQFELAEKATSSAELIGVGYKTKLKPAHAAFDDESKKNLRPKYEELVLVQQQSRQAAAELEERRKRIEMLGSMLTQSETRISSLNREAEEHMARRAAEAARLREEVERKSQHLKKAETEAQEVLKNQQQKLQNCVSQIEEETQLIAHDLLTLVDSVSLYKEHMEMKLSELMTELSETVDFLKDEYGSSLKAL